MSTNTDYSHLPSLGQQECSNRLGDEHKRNGPSTLRENIKIQNRLCEKKSLLRAEPALLCLRRQIEGESYIKRTEANNTLRRRHLPLCTPIQTSAKMAESTLISLTNVLKCSEIYPVIEQ